MKICLLGTQRCGSQFITEIIQRIMAAKKFKTTLPIVASDNLVVNLSEPFSFYKKNQYYLTTTPDNRVLRTTTPYPNVTTFDDHIDATMRVMEQATNPSQSIIMKMFFLNYDNATLQRIVHFLKKEMFFFIKIKRIDIEKQILSFLIAHETGNWRSTNHDKVTITNLSNISYMYDQIMTFDQKVTSFGLPAIQSITYETAIDDLKRIFAVDYINDTFTAIQKTGLPNPYDQIINADEVKAVMQKL